MNNFASAAINVAIYARVSTEEQKENFSLAGQLDLLRKYAANNRFEIYKEYVDPGFSGISYDRPAFQDLLHDAKQQKFQLILVYRLDRLFRSTKDLLLVSDYFEKLRIGLRSVTEPFDTSNYLGKFVLTLLGSIAQLERDIFIERSKLGRIRRAQEGYYSGSQPARFGYRYDRIARTLQVDTKESLVVSTIFNFYNQPESSVKKVARRLRALGYKTKEGKEFYGPTVFDVLKDPIYIGKWYANRYCKNGKFKPRDEWIEVKVPAIITQDTFNKAQRLLQQRKIYSIRNARHEYLLQGLMKCGDCGCSIAGTADKQYQIKNGKRYGPYQTLYYRCTHFSRSREIKCNLKYLQARMLESVVWKEVKRAVRNKPDFFKKTDHLGGDGNLWKKKSLLRLLNTKILVNVSGEIDISCEIPKSEPESINFWPFSQYFSCPLPAHTCWPSAG